MTLYRNTAEGLTNGTAMLADGSNTGGASGSAFTGKTGGAAIVADSARAAHGTKSWLINASANQGYATLNPGVTSATAAISFALYLNTALATSQDVAVLRNTAGAAIKLQILSTQILRIVHAGGSSLHDFATPLATGVWNRIELLGTKGTGATNGRIKAAHYLGDAITPVDPILDRTDTNAGTADFELLDWGKLTGGSNVMNANWDDICFETAADDFVGPFSGGGWYIAPSTNTWAGYYPYLYSGGVWNPIST